MTSTYFNNAEEFAAVLEESTTFRKLVARSTFLGDYVQMVNGQKIPRKEAAAIVSRFTGDKIGAIKKLREIADIGLKEAKDTIESWFAGKF